MKKFQVFLGLAVLVLVLWAAATPVNASDLSLIGSWVPTAPGCPCDVDDPRPCADYAGCSPRGPNVPYQEMLVCFAKPSGSKTCTLGSDTPCDYGNESCTSTFNMACE